MQHVFEYKPTERQVTLFLYDALQLTEAFTKLQSTGPFVKAHGTETVGFDVTFVLRDLEFGSKYSDHLVNVLRFFETPHWTALTSDRYHFSVIEAQKASECVQIWRAWDALLDRLADVARDGALAMVMKLGEYETNAVIHACDYWKYLGQEPKTQVDAEEYYGSSLAVVPAKKEDYDYERVADYIRTHVLPSLSLPHGMHSLYAPYY